MLFGGILWRSCRSFFWLSCLLRSCRRLLLNLLNGWIFWCSLNKWFRFFFCYRRYLVLPFLYFTLILFIRIGRYIKLVPNFWITQRLYLRAFHNLICIKNFIHDLIKWFRSTKVCIVYLRVFGWINSNKISLSLIFLNCLFNIISVSQWSSFSHWI
jgi:hypothetical protein